jgi:hypothetical protein
MEVVQDHGRWRLVSRWATAECFLCWLRTLENGVGAEDHTSEVPPCREWRCCRQTLHRESAFTL